MCVGGWGSSISYFKVQFHDSVILKCFLSFLILQLCFSMKWKELTEILIFCSDVLALPIFKQEDSNLPPENESKHPPFQYVLYAATSPAIKLHDETLTYLNQGIPV